MDSPEPALTAEDHSYRHAAEAYFSEKARLALSSFDEQLKIVFRSFEDHWRDFFAPEDSERCREYLTTPFEVRKAKFERFKRECRAWEVSFRLYAKPKTRATDPERSDLRRRLDEQRSKTERVRAFYDGLDSMLDREKQKRSHPLELLQHLRALELPADASLDDVKRQYKKLAKLHHPDVSGDAAMMSRLNGAYRAIVNFYKVA